MLNRTDSLIVISIALIAVAVVVVAAGTCNPPGAVPDASDEIDGQALATGDDSGGSAGTGQGSASPDDDSSAMGDEQPGDTDEQPDEPPPVTGSTPVADVSDPTRIVDMIVRIEVKGFGNIDIRLLPDNALLTVGTFLRMVNAGAYDNTRVHSVVNGSVFETGRFKVDGSGVTTRRGLPSEAENGLLNVAGSIATVPDDPDDPDSFTSAFAINVRDNPEYDFDPDTFFGRAVFGRIEAGLDVALAITRVSSTDGTPNEPPVIVSISEIAVP